MRRDLERRTRPCVMPWTPERCTWLQLAVCLLLLVAAAARTDAQTPSLPANATPVAERDRTPAAAAGTAAASEAGSGTGHAAGSDRHAAPHLAGDSAPVPVTRDPRILRAIDWLPRKPTTPIEIVDVQRLAGRIAREVRKACGFIIRGVPRIYISSRCPAYQRAEYNPLEAVALAAVIGHEMAHLDGADERQARAVEVDLVQTLAARLPGEYRVRAAVYAADLQHRRSPVVCETNPGGTAFHTCRAEVVELGGVARTNGPTSSGANTAARSGVRW